jgi:hypothetical protein
MQGLKFSVSEIQSRVYLLIYLILGKWKPNMWNNYPAHELEHIKKIPYIDETLV